MHREFIVYVLFISILYILFLRVTGWNEYSRFALTKSIIDCNSLTIDCYYNITGDRSYYNGHYYTDKAPGTSFILTPIYSAMKFIGLDFKNNTIMISESPSTSSIYRYGIMNTAELVFELLSIIIISVLPSVLIFKLIYSTGLSMNLSRRLAILVGIFFSLGTLIFPYSTVLFGNILASLVIFFGYLYFTRLYKFKSTHARYGYLTLGSIMGFAVLLDYVSIAPLISMFILIVFLSCRQRKYINMFYFLFGSLVGLLPFLIYNLVNFHDPFRISIFYIDRNIYPSVRVCSSDQSLFDVFMGVKHILVYRPMKIIRSFLYSMVYPYRGLLFYIPILIVPMIWFILGLFSKDLDKFLISSFVCITLLAYFILFSGIPTWFGGTSFGMRYLIPVIPLYSIPFLYVFSEHKSRKNMNIIIYLSILLFWISFFNMLISFSNFWEGPTTYNRVYSGYFYIDWKKELAKESELPKINALYNYYLKSALEHGIHPYLIYGIKNRNIDIRSMDIDFISHFFDIVIGTRVIYLPIGLILMSILMGIIIFISLTRLRSYSYATIVFPIAVMFFMVILGLKYYDFDSSPIIIFGNGWYPEEKNGRWMGNHSEIYVYVNRDGDYFIHLLGYGFKNNTMVLYLNDDVITNFTPPEVLFERIFLNKGKNILRLNPIGGCYIPYNECHKYYNFIDSKIKCDDVRCISFFIQNISLYSSDDIENILRRNVILFGTGWYAPEKNNSLYSRWMSEKGTLIVSNHLNSSLFVIEYTPYSYEFSDFEVYINNNVRRIHSNSNEIFVYLAKRLGEKYGYVNITLSSIHGCKVPATSNDFRCISIRLRNVTIFEHPQNTSSPIIIFGNGWYPEEKNGRWMGNHSEIYIFTPSKGIYNISFCVDIFPSNMKRKLILLDSSLFAISTWQLTTGDCINTSLKFDTSGIHRIVFRSGYGCLSPKDIGVSYDDRCLSFFVRNVSIFTE